MFRALNLKVFLLLSFLIFSCASSHINKNEYYLGLLDNSVPDKVKLFEKALSSSNEYIRQAAAEELAILMSQGKTLSRKTMERVRREITGFWAEAFKIADAPDKEMALSFFFAHEHSSASFEEASRFVMNACKKKNMFFSNWELGSIMGHYSVSCQRYNEALDYFRVFKMQDNWPEQIPYLFVNYPILINDLGKTFQYTQSGEEGIALFLQWLTDKDLSFDLQYRLNFYAGRIARRMGGQNAKGISFFEKALALAPDAEQVDACIWYILDLTITGSTNVFLERLTKFIPDWHRGSYYNDILERFLHKLVSELDWNKVIRTYDLIKNTSAASSKIGYARVIARSIENKYLSAEDMRLAARVIEADSADALAFYRIVYDIGIIQSIPSFISRSQSADALKEPFMVLTEETKQEPLKKEYSQYMQFIMGFFDNKAIDFMIPHIKELEHKLNIEELRIVAQTLHDEGNYPKCMEVVSMYIYKGGSSRNRHDWELLFPRPYLELIEKHAKDFGLAPSLLYGLIRSESAFRAAVVSHAGAVGLMQLMPFTAKDVAERMKREGGPNYFGENDFIDSTNPSLNVHIGTYYFKYLQDYFNDSILALMAYNGGQTRIRRYRSANNLPIDLFVETVPIYETRDYGKRVPAAARIYQELYYMDSK